MKRETLLSLAITLFITACSSPEIQKSHTVFPLQKKSKVAVYTFKNYTQTPMAGEKAASLTEGILSAKGYQTYRYVDSTKQNRIQMCQEAKSKGFTYLLTGSVQEWRYKTGIDGEPAVSLSIKLLETTSCNTAWSATASDSNWGNASIGTTAQELLSDLFQ